MKHLFLLERYKPEVVQYWQDETNVLGGIAALIAGIPRIALFTRSMRPSKITRRRRYLRSGYRELLKMPQVVLLNNAQGTYRQAVPLQDMPDLARPVID